MEYLTQLKKRILFIFGATTLLLMANTYTTAANLLPAPPEQVTICHKPATPAENTLTLPSTAIEGHIGHGDRLGSCEVRLPCTQPPTPPLIDVGTEPNENEQEWGSESVATLENASETGLTAAGAPITFRLSCNTLNTAADSVIVYDNGLPLPYAALTLTDNSVTLTNGLSSGRHNLALLALDVFGFTIESRVVLWAGNFSIPVLVIDEGGAPVAGAEVVAKLSDDPKVTTTIITDAAGQGTLTNLPNRSFNIVASSSDNRIATRPASVFDGLVTLQLLGFKPASTIDNNDFSQGTAGWEIGSAPVSIVQHVEVLSLLTTQSATTLKTTDTGSSATRLLRTPENSALLVPVPAITTAAITAAAEPDFDLRLTTSGEGQQKISRTFDVEDGIKSVTVRYRFITSEVPGGWFGSEFNDFYNVSIRTVKAGGSVKAGNSMNGLGLAAFDANGATGWVETELEVAEGGDTVQVDIAVANVADQYFDSQVIVDGIKKKKLTISDLQLDDIDGSGLQYLSASSHPYFGGQTRVHGTITIKGPKDDTLEDLKVEVIEGGTIATGTLNPALAATVYRAFDDTEEIKIDASQLLFEIPAGQLASASQGSNGVLTLRVKARSSGDDAEKDFGPVTKLTRFTGGSRYGGRDEAEGGDDWAKPGVRTLIETAALTWGDFSNMNGGSFPPHQSHQSGNSADGWFTGYNARNAATAVAIIGHLNTHGTRIRSVYVTFGSQSEFANAITGVTLNDGRAATSVIRNIGGHATHFHWEVTD